MKTKFISSLLALSMAVAYLFSVPAFAEGEKFSGGTGAQDDPYLISTAEDMWQLSADCKSGSYYEKKYASKYFKMTEDIDLGCSAAKQWIPIGNYDGRVYFSGDFNGDGHTITGLYIDNSAQNQGLFGCTSQSTVQNLTVEGTVKGGSRVAGITAYSMSGITINNCSFKGTVYAKDSYAGGIAAHVYGGGNLTNCANEATVTAGGEYAGGIAGTGYCNISGCKNMGKVKGANYVAGISGCSAESLTDGTISDCYNTGAITGTGKRIGGIVGQYYMRGSVTGCYNTGDINGGSAVGGIVGDHSPDRTVSLCFNSGNISGGSEIGGISGEMCNGGVVKNCYNLGDVSAMTNSAGGIVGYYWSGSAGNSGNTRIESAYNTGTVTASSSYDSIIGFTRNGSIVVNTVYLQGSCSENKYGTEVTKGQLANTATYSSWNSFDSIWQIPAALGRPILLNPEETVKIATADDMCKLYENVQKGNTYKNIYIELTDDIDFDGYDWLPIGSYDTDEDSARPFLGNFNGNGHTISNLNCDAGSAEYQGLFGYVGTGGQVRNVIMDDSCFFSAGEHTAAIAALNAGTIENCKNYAEVIGDEYTGGIVGENAKDGVVKKCYNAGAITSTGSEVGGIAGYNIEATISECANEGSVDADVSFSGGIVGQNHTGEVTNCYNTGEVRAVRAYSGGVAGQSIGIGANVTNCYSYGRVYSYQISGGVAGSNINDSMIEKCYYLEDTADGGISGENNPRSAWDVSGSAEKLTEAQFKKQSSFSGWDFDNGSNMGVWIMGTRPYLDCAITLNLKGSGTEENPYLIRDADDLDNMRLLVNTGRMGEGAHFLITDDIDLNNSAGTPIGISYNDNPFNCIFDGGGHTVKGFSMSYSSNLSLYGFFGYIGTSGVVRNLNLEGEINLEGDFVGKVWGMGGIAYNNNGTIENCSFSGNLSNNTTDHFETGGIVGCNEDGRITNCHSEGKIYSSPIIGTYEGGIAGQCKGGTISSCYSAIDIEGGEYAGGIVGKCLEKGVTIENCYNIGSIKSQYSGGSYSAGIIANIWKYVTIRNCYNIGTLNGDNKSAICTIKSQYYKPTASNCYYLTGTGTDSIGSTAVTVQQFESGEVAYRLQSGQTEQVWGQTLAGDEADASPILTTDTTKSVHKITYSTKSNSNYATGYGTGEGVAYIPSYSGSDFTGWSLPDSKFLTEDTPITSDITVYAASQEMYGETEGDKTIRIDYGRGGSVDLSGYIVYQKGTGTKGKYTYTIDSGNDLLKASISGDTLTIPTSVPVGAYNLQITATEKTPNISLMSVSFDNLPVTMNITVVVGKRDATVTAPKAKSLTYNGSDQELVTAGLATGGTLMYSLDGKNYSTDIPKETNAGNYTVYYKLDGGDEFNDIAAQSINVTISQKNAELTNPTPNAAVYGTKLSAITLPEGWRWTDASVVPPVKNSGYEAVYSVSDYTNYNWNTVSGYDSTNHTVTRNITVTITKANPVVTAPAGKSLKTTGEMQELIYAGKTTGGTLVYSLDGKTYSADIPKAQEKGNYTVYYKVLGDDNYNDTEPQTITAELGKFDIPEDKITYPKAVKSLEYNGEKQELITAGEIKDIKDAKFIYSLDNTAFSEEIPTALNAGIYTVYYKLDGGEIYNDVPSRMLNVVIAKQNPAADTVAKALELYEKIDSQNLIYGIKLSDIELTECFEWVDGNIVPEVDYANHNGYPAKMHIEDDNNYDWDGVEGYDSNTNIWWIDLPFEMQKADIKEVTAPVAKELTYTGNAQELVARGSAEGGKIEYSLNGTDYSDTVPTGTNAGEYTIYYKTVGDSNHNDTEPKMVKATIKKKLPQLVIPDVSQKRVVYGTKLSEITLPNGWSWVEDNTIPIVNNNGYDAKISINYDANYDWESIAGYNPQTNTVTRTLVVNVDKAPSNEPVPTNITAIYGDTLSDTALPEQWKWDNPETSVGNAGTHSFPATYTPRDNDNYKEFNANISVDVQKANPAVTDPTAKDVTYTGLAQELVTAASTSGGTLLYSIDGDNYFTSVPKGRNAGEYTVHYLVEGDGNYNAAEEKTITVTIKKAKLNLTVSMPDWTIGGDAPDPVISGNISGGDVTYAYKVKDADDSTYTTEKPSMYGEFTVRAIVSETANYESAAVTANFTVREAEGAPVARYLVYNGEPQTLLTAENDNFVYSLDGESYSSQIPTGTNAGTYTIYYKIGNSSAQTLDVTIIPAMPVLTEPDITDSYVYGKHLYEIPLPAGWMWVSADIVPDVNNSGYEAVYRIKSDDEDESYKNYDWSNVVGYDEKTLTVTRTLSVSITKADMAVAPPRAKIRTYNNNEQELITAGSVRGGQILYSLNGTDFTTTVPVAVDAGTYIVYYKTVADANHNDGASGNITAIIFPKDAELTEPTISGITYGTKLSDIELPGGWEWIDDGETIPTVTNSGYAAKYRVKDDSNYTWVSVEGYDSAENTVTRKLPVTVNKAVPVADIPAARSAAYGSKLSDIELDSGWKWLNSDESVGNAGIHIFTAIYTPSDTDNFETLEGNVIVTVNKAPSKVGKIEANQLAYSGANQELVTASDVIGGTLLYSVDDKNYSSAVPSGKNAGEYMVYYKVKGDENHLDTEAEKIIARIEKSDIALNVLMLNFYEDGEISEPIIYGNTGKSDVICEYKPQNSDDSEYSEKIPNKQGVYNIRATASETDNYNSATATSLFAVLPSLNSKMYSIMFIDRFLCVKAPQGGPCTVIFAAYKNGMLKNISHEEMVFSSNGMDRVLMPDQITAGEPDEVRAMLWSDLKEMTPLCNPAKWSSLE